MVGRTVGPFAGRVHAFLLRHGSIESSGNRSGLGRHAEHDLGQCNGLGLGFGVGIEIGRIGHCLHGSRHRLGAGLKGKAHHGLGNAVGLEHRATAGQRIAHIPGRAGPRAQQHHTACGNGGHLVQRQLLAARQGKIPLFHRVSHHGSDGVAAECARSCLLGNQHQQQITFFTRCGSSGQSLQFKVHNRCFPFSQCYSIHPYAKSWPAALARRPWF